MAPSGRLVGIARRNASRVPMESLAAGRIGVECGIEGDYRGTVRPGKSTERQVTVLSHEAWQAACAEIGQEVPWTARRANLLVEMVTLPRQAGAVIAIGEVRLEVHAEIAPCERMDESVEGLRAALVPDWRGGVGCRVLQGGNVAVGDRVWVQQQ